jgi:hypothetical protein
MKTLEMLAAITAALVALHQLLTAVVALLPAGAFRTRLGQAAAFVANLTPKDAAGTLKPPFTRGPLPPDDRVTIVPGGPQ